MGWGVSLAVMIGGVGQGSSFNRKPRYGSGKLIPSGNPPEKAAKAVKACGYTPLELISDKNKPKMQMQ